MPTIATERRSQWNSVLRRTVTPAVAAVSLLACVQNIHAQDTNMIPSYKPIVGIGYSPFQGTENPNLGSYPTVAQISADLTNVVINLTGAIRTFGDTETLSNIPSLCYQYGIDCYPCAWLGGTSADTNSLNILIDIANHNYSTTKGLLVGSEALQGGYLTASALLADVQYVKAGLKPGITVPVGTADTWNTIISYPQLVTNLDFAMINIYPYWEGVTIENSASDILSRYNNFKATYPNTRVIVGEMGEPSGGTANNGAPVSQASMSNQQYFLETVLPMEKSNNIPYFYFEVFDETWKVTDGAGTVETNWGLYYANRTMKPSLSNFLSENLTASVSGVQKSNRATLVVQTYAGDPYSVYASSNLLAGWSTNPILRFTGAQATNQTTVTVTNTGWKDGFFRLRQEF